MKLNLCCRPLTIEKLIFVKLIELTGHNVNVTVVILVSGFFVAKERIDSFILVVLSKHQLKTYSVQSEPH